MTTVVPRLEVLPHAQRILWPQLSVVGAEFVLYGGTALSLQVGGRTSVDFDFFSPGRVDPARLAREFQFLRGASLIQQASDTASFVVGSGSDGVAISFFGSLGFGRVSEPIRFADNGLFAAGLLDLAAQKMTVIQQRAQPKDYLDIHKLLSEGISLEMALGAAQALYPEFNPAISLKALSYYRDVPRVPPDIQRELTAAASRFKDTAPIKKIDTSLLPNLGAIGAPLEIGDFMKPDLSKERDRPELEL